jgi:hypothetical protein
MSHEQLFIRGIPFLRDIANKIYNYDRANPICIGSYDPTTEQLTLDADYRDKLADSLALWRSQLIPSKRGEIKQEAKSKKQGRIRRSTKKSTEPSGGAGEEPVKVTRGKKK